MRNLLIAGRFLLADMASTLFFLALYLWTGNIPLSVALGIALGFAQIAWQGARKKPIDTMQWLSLFLVVASGSATLLTHDARFVMIKPTLIYIIVGIVMLKPGWMNRYLPPIAMEVVPDIAMAFGFVWSVMMFFSAGLNIYVALNYDVVVWASFMSLYGIASKLALFLIQYTLMRTIGVRRRRRAQQNLAGAGLSEGPHAIMSDPTAPSPTDHDQQDETAEGRWRFIGDVLALQLKLLIGNLHNLVLIPATLAAAALDLLFKADTHGARFYRVLDWGRKADEAIGLYSALDRDESAVGHDFTVDAVVSNIEAVIAREYAKGGTAASVKAAVDQALDKLHTKTGKGTAKAREAAQKLAEKIRPTGKDPA